jgi:hypothetical protein
MTQLIGTEQLTGNPSDCGPSAGWQITSFRNRTMWGHPQHVEHSHHEWANPNILGRFPHDQAPWTPAVSVFPPGSRISLLQGRRYGVHHGRE